MVEKQDEGFEGGKGVKEVGKGGGLLPEKGRMGKDRETSKHGEF